MKHILPLSSLRFVLAMWVMLGHFGIPVLSDKQHTFALIASRSLLNNTFNGPAAVIVFFVISGFCIHFPNRYGLELGSWKMYFTRRYVRILIPMAVAIAMSMPLGIRFGLFTNSILWSLLCEEIYYLVYPGLLVLKRLLGWHRLMIGACALSVLVVLTDPRALEYPSYGPALNWALGLPCWLLGCRLAEQTDGFSLLPVSAGEIWLWRSSVWIISVLLSFMRFHTPIGYPWTLNPFALVATFWLEREIRFYRGRGSPKFESLGEASYSIYLTHVHGSAFLHLLRISKALSSWGLWSSALLLSGSFAVVFYWLVERPSHRLARHLGRRSALRGSKREMQAAGS